jgi:ABC-2 type transport system ATP-binding protein
MGQRLALASALLGVPGVLILDEPANGLDAEGIRWLRELLRQMAADGRTVFLSSHLMTEMSLVADHLIVIHEGRIIADASLAEFAGHGTLEDAFLRAIRADSAIREQAGE